MRFLMTLGFRSGVHQPPLKGWREAYSSQHAAVWTRADARSPSTPLLDGCMLGGFAGTAKRFADLAGGWGGYVAVGERGRTVSVVRDPSGSVPAYWMHAAETVVICSHLEDLAPFLDRPLELDWTTLTALLMGSYMAGRRTGFQRVQEILPGEILQVSPGQVSSMASWDPAAFWSAPFRSVQRARQALRQAAESSVRFWAQRYGQIMVDLSGGLDSSAVVGLLARLPRPPSVICLNGRVNHDESDEREFARAVAGAAGIALAEADASATLASYADPVPGPLQPRPTAQLRRGGLDAVAEPYIRRYGVQAYFTGRGGDHLFYSGIPILAARDRLAIGMSAPGFLKTAYNVARATGQPFGKVLRAAIAPPKDSRSLKDMLFRPTPFVSREAAEAVAAEEFTHPWVQAAMGGAPVGKIRQVCHLVELQRHYDRIGRAAIIDEVHPFISQPLMESSLRTPSYMFVPDGVPRGLQREVFADVLPQLVRDRRNKGATTSHSIRTLLHNLPYLRERLLEGDLVTRGVLNRAALEAHLTPESLLDGRSRPGLAECVSAQLWLDLVRSSPISLPSPPGR